MNQYAKPIAALFVWLLLPLRFACGHGQPIDVAVDAGNQLAVVLDPETNLPTFSPGELEYFASADRTFGDTPGIAVATTSQGVAPGTLIGLNVASPLYFWNGSEIASTDSQLTIFAPSGDRYDVHHESSPQTGMQWATYSGAPHWHEHGLFVLEPPQSESGIYGVFIELTSPSYETSHPFLLPLIFDPVGQLTNEQVDLGLSSLRALLEVPLVPGDTDGDGDVDTADLTNLTANWTGALELGAGGKLRQHGDFDEDGDVDTADLSTLTIYWTGAVATVPEPCSQWAVLIAAISMLRRFVARGRRHRENFGLYN